MKIQQDFKELLAFFHKEQLLKLFKFQSVPLSYFNAKNDAL